MRVAVITGGAGGLGRALSRQLLAEGWQVVALDLDVTGLEPAEGLWPIACDLTDRSQRGAALEQVLARHPALDLVIYNAGITQIGPCDALSEAAHRKVFEINYFAATAMAQHCLEAVRAARGTHLAVSSVAGFTPLYHRTAYAASKHALEGFFKSLRSEEAAHGVQVSIAAPSFVATNIGNDQRQEDGTARPGSAGDGVDYMQPIQAAQVILHGISRGAAMIPVGRVARIAWWLNRLSPGTFERLMRRRIAGATDA